MTDTTHPEMACRELVELVTDYLEDRLSLRDRARFEAHLSDCEYCATYVEQMRLDDPDARADPPGVDLARGA
jgi:anti-sigma factor RsiW